MTYDEALQALDRPREMLRFNYDITQAKEVFKQMKMDLDQCKADLKLLEMLSKSLG